MYGAQTYIDKEHHLDRKREEYLFGIMKNATERDIAGQKVSGKGCSPDFEGMNDWIESAEEE